jgi:hypothetical protein
MKNEKYLVIEKAYCLNNNNLEEPYFIDTDIIYYGTRGQVKKKALPDYDSCKIYGTTDYVEFHTIKVKRRPQFDKIMFGDKIIKRFQLEEFERKESIKTLPKDKIYVVQDRRSYVGNAVLWWGINGNGYVCDIHKAHKYTYDELQKFKPRDTDIIWDIDHVMTATKLIVDAQYLNKEFSI